MKNVSTLSVIASLLLVAPASFAKTYVGLELGGGKSSTSLSSTGIDSEDLEDFQRMTDSMDSAGYARLFAGQYVTQNLRVYGYAQLDADVTVEYFDMVENEKDTLKRRGYEFDIGGDYLYFVTQDWFVVAGGTLGYYDSEVLLTNVDNGVVDFHKESRNGGVSAGLNLGTGYQFTESFTVELGLRHSRLFGNEHKMRIGDEETMTFKFDSKTQGYINASYRF